MSDEYLLQRLRENIRRLTYGERRVTEPQDASTVDARESIRQLARMIRPVCPNSSSTTWSTANAG